MITAQEAYDLARPNYDKHIEFLNNKIKEAAKQNKVKIIVREQPYRDWLYSTEKIGKEEKEVINSLKTRGFSISFYYREDIQFVDCGLVISWDKK